MRLWLGLLNATIQAINAKIDHIHFLLTDSSTVPVDILVNPINPTHGFVVMFDQE